MCFIGDHGGYMLGWGEGDLGICLGGVRETRVCVLVRPGLCD